MRVFCVVYFIFCTFPSAFALDREAFTFTNYNLEARIEAEQQRLGVRGKITLRNDSDSPQRNAALQISSTLSWSSIRLEGHPVDFVRQVYTSDIDHTGALAEAIVNLPRAVAPKQSIELEIGYEGIIPLDTTRLTRIGTPAEIARHSDWDQISSSFTAVRGAGYVAWYPIATEAANLSESNSVLKTAGRWKQREVRAGMSLRLVYSGNNSKGSLELRCTGKETNQGSLEAGGGQILTGDCLFSAIGPAVPTITVGPYSVLDREAISIHYLPDHKSAAEDYASAAEEITPLVDKWFGEHRDKSEPGAQVIELPDSAAAPFESGNMLLTPLGGKDANLLLSSIHLLTRIAFPSPRSWISDGLAGYAQLSFLQERMDRGAVIAYLQNHRPPLLESEKETPEKAKIKDAENSLINTYDEFYVATKAANVWWMLRDIVGEAALTAALHNYSASEDNRPDYMEKLIEKQSHRDLEWFFDDWVYRDRGLPDFRVVSVYPRPLVTGGYMVTVTVENLGAASGVVLVILHMPGGEASDRLRVLGNSQASVRVQAAALPQLVTLNDGSVPETNTSNNTYKIESTNQTSDR